MKGQDIPLTVGNTVRALCADYDRRALEIRKGTLSPALLGHYMMLNGLIDEAIGDCCEEGIREVIRHDIGEGIGHRNTRLYYIGANTYKDRKRRSKIAIARALKLL